MSLDKNGGHWNKIQTLGILLKNGSKDTKYNISIKENNKKTWKEDYTRTLCSFCNFDVNVSIFSTTVRGDGKQKMPGLTVNDQ